MAAGLRLDQQPVARQKLDHIKQVFQVLSDAQVELQSDRLLAQAAWGLVFCKDTQDAHQSGKTACIMSRLVQQTTYV